jgi:hypothetical protein
MIQHRTPEDVRLYTWFKLFVAVLLAILWLVS